MSGKPHFIFLTGVVSHNFNIPFSRYAGPYVLSSQLEEAGYDVTIVDWFLIIDNFFSYIKKLVRPETIAIGISTTYLFPTRKDYKINDTGEAGQHFIFKDTTTTEAEDETSLDRSSLDIEFIKSQMFYLWETSNSELKSWMLNLRAVTDKVNPNLKIIFGGHRLSRIYQDTDLLEDDYALFLGDYFVLGHADTSLPVMLEHIKNGTENQIKTINKRGMKWVDSAIPEYLHQPKPIPKAFYKKKDAIFKNEWLSTEPSRGCKFNCSFCSHERLMVYKKAMETLKEEFLFNYENFGTTGYHFTSDCFNDNKPFVLEFAEMVATLPFKIEYCTYARADLFYKNEDMIVAMKESGFKAGWFGVETFNIEAGRFAGKNPTHVKELLIKIKEIIPDLWMSMYMIIGLPKDTVESLYETLEWLKNQSVIDEVSASVLSIPTFIEELSSVIDYSDMTNSPEQFGFTKIQYDPYFYWEHESMNLNQAIKVKKAWEKGLYYHKYTRFGGSARGEYPAIRGIGLSQDQTRTYMKTKFNNGANLTNLTREQKANLRKLVRNKVYDNINNYHKELITLNAR